MKSGIVKLVSQVNGMIFVAELYKSTNHWKSHVSNWKKIYGDAFYHFELTFRPDDDPLYHEEKAKIFPKKHKPPPRRVKPNGGAIKTHRIPKVNKSTHYL